MNALEQHPDEFRRIVRDALERYIDPDLPHKNERQGEEWEDDVEDRVATALEDAGVDDDLEDLEARLEDFNEAYAAVADVFERLHGLVDDESALGTREATVEDVIGAVEYPVATIPEGTPRCRGIRSTTRVGSPPRIRCGSIAIGAEDRGSIVGESGRNHPLK